MWHDQTSQPKKSGKPAIKKGFLEEAAKKNKQLYPEGGSSEGAGGATGGAVLCCTSVSGPCDMTCLHGFRELHEADEQMSSSGYRRHASRGSAAGKGTRPD